MSAKGVPREREITALSLALLRRGEEERDGRRENSEDLLSLFSQLKQVSEGALSLEPFTLHSTSD